MNNITYTITDPLGIHARPCGMLVKLIKSLPGKYFVSKGEKKVEATRLIALMGLGIKKGDQITVSVEDIEAAEAAANLQKIAEFLKANL